MFDDRHQSAIGSCHHGSTNVCGSTRIYRWEKFCREGSCGSEKEIRTFSLHFYMSRTMAYAHKIPEMSGFIADEKSPWIIVK